MHPVAKKYLCMFLCDYGSIRNHTKSFGYHLRKGRKEPPARTGPPLGEEGKLTIGQIFLFFKGCNWRLSLGRASGRK